MTEDTGLSAGELLFQIYNRLGKELKGRQIALPHNTMSEIADDSDHHRSRTGYMGYESITLIQINEKYWALGCGRACGGYPADPYDSDIIVLPVSPDGKPDEDLAQKICEAIEETEYFKDSIVVSLANGCLGFSERSSFGKGMAKVLELVTSDYIAQQLEIDHTVFHMDRRSIIKSAMRYKPGTVDLLKDSIVKLLTEAS